MGKRSVNKPVSIRKNTIKQLQQFISVSAKKPEGVKNSSGKRRTARERNSFIVKKRERERERESTVHES